MVLRLPAIMKTTAARLSALYFVLFALCAVLLVLYMTSLSARMLAAQTMETINEEVQGLDRAYRRGGLPVLVRVIEQRSRQPGANLYLIADPNGRILTGNVESLEPGVLEIEGWTVAPFSYQRYGEGSIERRSGAEAEIRRRAGGQRDEAQRDCPGFAPAEPDDRACRARPRRAGAVQGRRPPRLDVCSRHDGAWRAADLVFCRPPRAEADRQRFGSQPPHHGRRSFGSASDHRRGRRIRPAVRKPQRHADQDRRLERRLEAGVRQHRP